MFESFEYGFGSKRAKFRAYLILKILLNFSTVYVLSLELLRQPRQYSAAKIMFTDDI